MGVEGWMVAGCPLDGWVENSISETSGTFWLASVMGPKSEAGRTAKGRVMP